MNTIKDMQKSAPARIKFVLNKHWRVLGLAGLVLVMILAAVGVWLRQPAGSTNPTSKQPEYVYKTTDGYSYAVSLTDVTFDRANAKPGSVNLSAIFTIRNLTDGHKAPLPGSKNVQIIVFDTAAHPECSYAKFRVSPGACNLERATLETRVGMFYSCHATGYSIDPGANATCTVSLPSVDETRYKQLGEKAIKNMIVGYIGTKNSQIDEKRCIYSFYGSATLSNPWEEPTQCKPGYTAQPGDARLGDEAYASDWHALNSKW
jgi:hypothetical protein